MFVSILERLQLQTAMCDKSASISGDMRTLVMIIHIRDSGTNETTLHAPSTSYFRMTVISPSGLSCVLSSMVRMLCLFKRLLLSRCGTGAWFDGGVSRLNVMVVCKMKSSARKTNSIREWQSWKEYPTKVGFRGQHQQSLVLPRNEGDLNVGGS